MDLQQQALSLLGLQDKLESDSDSKLAHEKGLLLIAIEFSTPLLLLLLTVIHIYIHHLAFLP